MAEEHPELVVTYMKSMIKVGRWANEFKRAAAVILDRQTFYRDAEDTYQGIKDVDMVPNLSPQNLACVEIGKNFMLSHGYIKNCYGLTEAGAGCDAAALKCRAVLKGDKYIVNGAKMFITNGPTARYCVLAATTDPSLGYKGVINLIVDLHNTPGFKVGKIEEKMGIRASGTCELVFEDAEVPADQLLGKVGQGFQQMMAGLNAGRIGVGSQACGIGRAALEDALAYAKERVQFGQPISSFQAIQFKLTDMATQLDAAELLLLRAAWLEDNHLNFEKEAAMAKYYASDVAMNAAIEGVQIFGGYGYVNEYPAERHMRDAKICQIYEGTNEIQRVVVARKLLGAR